MIKLALFAAGCLPVITSTAFAASLVTVSSVVGDTTVVPLDNYSAVSGMSADSTGRSFDLGYVQNGSYVVYSLNVAQAGTYSVLLNYAEPSSSSGVNLLVNGTQQTSVAFSSTGSWSTYYNASSALVTLPAGQVSFEVYAPTAGFNLGGLQLQLLSATPSTAGIAVSALTPTTIPLQSYSAISGMSPDSTGKAYDLGYTNSGGYADYPLSVTQAGNYSLVVNYASVGNGNGVLPMVNGTAQQAVVFSNTGAWYTYVNSAASSVQLPAGQTTLRIFAETGGFNLGGLTLTPVTALSPLAYYVSPSGNDSNDGKTTATPFATLQHAADVVQPGYTVYAMAGTYTNSDWSSTAPSQNVLNIRTSGTQAAPIVFTNYPGQSPVIKFDSFYGIQISKTASYITLSGFEIAGDGSSVSASYAQSASYGDPLTNGTGISVSGDSTGVQPSTHIVIQNMVIHDCPLNGIGVGYSDYITIQDNTLYHNAYWSPFAGSGISVLGLFDSDSDTTDYKNFVIRNISYGNSENVPNFQAYNLITDGNGILFDSLNHQNTSYPPYAGRTLVANNLVYSNGGAGISAYLSANIDVVDNTAYMNNQNMTYPIGQITGYYATNVKIIDNIMVSPTGKPANSSQGNTSVTVDYNLYFGGSGPQMAGSHDISGDPLFIGVQTNNFLLQSTSPALSTGTAWPSVTSDLLKNARPGSNGTFEKGAYQQ